MALLRSWKLLLLVSLSTIRESRAFSERLVVPSRTLRPTPFNTNNPFAFPAGRRRNNRLYRDHKALSVPFSGPPVDPRSAWADIVNPHISIESNHEKITKMDQAILAGTGVAAAFGLYAVIFFAAPGAWRYFAAGGICAATSHAIPTPIDVVKTRKQVDPEIMDVSFLAAATKIMKDDGMAALWAGLGPTAVGYLFEGAVKFGTYEILKPFFKRILTELASATSISLFRSQILSFIFCGASAGFAASIMLCPMEAIRIRIVSEHDCTDGGWLKAGYKILKNEGVEGLCKGMTPMIMKQVPYTITKNVSFDVLTKSLYALLKTQGLALSTATMFMVPLFSAGLSSILSTVTSQPGDMVLSLVNAHKGDRRSSDIFKSILSSPRGIGGFFVGFKTRLLHVGVTVTIQLMVYDYVKRICGIAATGIS